jgi:hypothetical protein
MLKAYGKNIRSMALLVKHIAKKEPQSFPRCGSFDHLDM